ncbi:hypothetical protein NDU88_004189 [Pleurodeles waltl]|uniref:Uncharacterized protein n=1 Tax=Pleurodeles waltl TaxID=8319 RepID=A0AAV7W741_PLEWA|nr:hypothetical protein NDU88_004189 [Pleurodeles waltl]
MRCAAQCTAEEALGVRPCSDPYITALAVLQQKVAPHRSGNEVRGVPEMRNLESYLAGTAGPKQVDRKQPQRRGKRRHSKDSLGDRQVTKPTRLQEHQGKRAALQAAPSLMEARSSEDGQRSEPGP